MEGASEQRVRAAVGPRADYYVGRWAAMDASGRTVSWNWAACLANAFWLAWRKMWVVLVLFILANVAIALAGAAFPLIGRYAHLPMIGLTFVTGAWGNLFYRRKVDRLVADAAGLGEEAALERLRRRGGTSPLALAVALALTLAGGALLVRQAMEQMRAGPQAGARG